MRPDDNPIDVRPHELVFAGPRRIIRLPRQSDGHQDNARRGEQQAGHLDHP